MFTTLLKPTSSSLYNAIPTSFGKSSNSWWVIDSHEHGRHFQIERKTRKKVSTTTALLQPSPPLRDYRTSVSLKSRDIIHTHTHILRRARVMWPQVTAYIFTQNDTVFFFLPVLVLHCCLCSHVRRDLKTWCKHDLKLTKFIQFSLEKVCWKLCKALKCVMSC